MKIYDHNIKINRGYGNINTIKKKNLVAEYRSGTFKFDKGVVEILSKPDYIYFSFLFQNIEYTRTIVYPDKIYTDNGLIRMAAKYGREIVKNVNKSDNLCAHKKEPCLEPINI